MGSDKKDIVLKWYYRSKLDYFDSYINLFISYNAWFAKATGETSDRNAINKLKERNDIWDEYLAGEVLQDLEPIASQISALTNERPLQNLTGGNTHWDGIMKDSKDWPSLIEFWYRVRCNIFHGSKTPEDDREVLIVELAYKSLEVFMREIVGRIENNFSKDHMFRAYEVNKIIDSIERSIAEDNYDNEQSKQHDIEYLEGLKTEAEHLSQTLNDSKNLWEVDLSVANQSE
jgi:hypothetical protein